MVFNQQSNSIETVIGEIPGVVEISGVRRIMQVDWTTTTKSETKLETYFFLGPYRSACRTHHNIQANTFR